MTALVSLLGNSLPDLALLASGAILFSLFGAAVAWASNRFWFQRFQKHSAFDDKLADTAHSGLLALAAFIVALMIANGLASLARTEDSVRQESGAIHRLGRELAALGPPGDAAGAALAAYARDVANDEWRRLAHSPNTLSPLAQDDLDTLWTDLRALQTKLDPGNPARADFTHWADKIETLRQTRLSDASTNIPDAFWLILVVIVATASFISGREAPERFGMQVNMIHMAAIGLAVGLVVILDNPFRGQTSIEPAIIGHALGS